MNLGKYEIEDGATGFVRINGRRVAVATHFNCASEVVRMDNRDDAILPDRTGKEWFFQKGTLHLMPTI
jgi:hypothetical protein